MSRKEGGCHCGAVKWEADLPDEIVADDCNCSICTMTGFVHVIVPAARFHLLSGEEAITEYNFGSGVARHFFCKRCGVKSYYIPRSNPDGVSLNLHCMDNAQFSKVEIRPFDGQNWEKNAASLAHLSQE
ncbi:MAG: GFA family protein [Parvularculaceae bacterium]